MYADAVSFTSVNIQTSEVSRHLTYFLEDRKQAACVVFFVGTRSSLDEYLNDFLLSCKIFSEI